MRPGLTTEFDGERKAHGSALRGAAAFDNQTLQFTLAQSRASSGADRTAGAGLATCAFAQQESSQGGRRDE